MIVRLEGLPDNFGSKYTLVVSSSFLDIRLPNSFVTTKPCGVANARTRLIKKHRTFVNLPNKSKWIRVL